MTDKEKLDAIRAEIHRLVDVRCYDRKMANDLFAFMDSLPNEPVSGLDNGDMPVERWKQAVKAASNQRNYRSSKGLTETCDDYFVDGVQWADEHPIEEPVSEDLLDTTQTITYKGEVYTRCYKDKLDAFACKYPMSIPKSSKRYAKYSDVDLTIAVKDGAQWQKEQFEKNRLKHCNSITNEQAELESDFIDQHLDKYQRMPTFLDAIEYGMNLQKKQMIAKAIDGIVHRFDGCGVASVHYNDPNGVPMAYFIPSEGLSAGDKVKIITIKED